MKPSELDIEQLFESARLLPPSEQSQFLSKACQDDSTVLFRVEKLLQADRLAGEFLSGPGARKQDEISILDDQGFAGTRVGSYKVLQKLGEGGMGVVYLAEQDSQLRRRVALKIIKPGMDSAQVLARFEAERQAIALMEHPHIARVIDTGSTEKGYPFFVMELVKGLSIIAFCDERKLTIRQRLELFIPVCLAIQHAHQKGIIHRDIKPSNVLVTHSDDRPIPIVIDFGVAKAISGRATDLTLTGMGTVVGTPEYMSPEQAGWKGLDIDTRSDVYSLGVLLFELLTGTTPVDRKSLGQVSTLEILRQVREVDPPKPSSRLAQSAKLESLAQNRSTDGAKLVRKIRGELDWIVLRALEKERNRRYDTAAALARDIQRYLADEMVEARPPSTRYRLLKIARRFRGQVILGALVLFALIAGIIGTTWGLFEARTQKVSAELAKSAEKEQRIIAQNNFERAMEERERAQKIGKFLLSDLLGQESTWSLTDETPNPAPILTFPQAVERAATKLDAAFKNQPLIEAEVRWAVGNAYSSVGEYAKSVGELEKAVDLFTRFSGLTDPNTMASRNELALAYLYADKFERALDTFKETLSLQKSLLTSDQLDPINYRSNPETGYLDTGKLDLGLPFFESDEAREKIGPALKLYQQVLDLKKNRLGDDHPDTLISLNNLAVGYIAASQPESAIPLLEESTKTHGKKYPRDHPASLLTRTNLAMAYKATGKLDEAMVLLDENRKWSQERFGPKHPATLRSMHDLAVGYCEGGKTAKALELFEETVKLQKAKLGIDHPNTLRTMTHFGLCYQKAGQLDKAIQLLTQTLELRRTKHGSEHANTLRSMNDLAQANQAAGKFEEAATLLNQAAFVMKIKSGPDSIAFARQIGLYASNFLKEKKWVEAQKAIESVMDRLEKKDHWSTFHLQSLLGEALLQQKKYSEAESRLITAWEGLSRLETQIPKNQKSKVLDSARRLVLLYHESNNREKEQTWTRKIEDLAKPK